MRLGRFGLLATVLLLIGTVAFSATGCVLVPYPVGAYGHYNGHDEQDGRPLALGGLELTARSAVT